MTITRMDVVYVITSNSPEMTPTPGDLLAAELVKQGKDRAYLARKLEVNWPTIDRWIRNIGFTLKNRVSAALALDLQPDAFEVVERTVEHRALCEKRLDDFLASPIGADASEWEKAALRSVQFPLDKAPTQAFYVGFLMLLRGQLELADFQKELALNADLARSVDEKMSQIEEIARMFEKNRKDAAERRQKKREGGEK